MSFNYQIKKENGNLILHFEGRILDRSDADELMGKVEEQFEGGAQNIVINLGGIDYINSAGLTVLINLLTLSRNKYGELAICEVPEKVSKLLVTSKLHNIFEITNTEAEAIALISKKA